MVVCLQCSMKAQVENRPYQGEKDPTIEAHMARVHPDPMAARRERVALEQELERRVAP